MLEKSRFCVSEIFIFRKNIYYFFEKYIKIQNFPLNPKIILRKSCEQFKNTKYWKSIFFTQIFLIPHSVTYTDPLSHAGIRTPTFDQKFEIVFGSSELIAWLRWSEGRDFLFLESPMSSNHQKKWSGAICNTSWCR